MLGAEEIDQGPGLGVEVALVAAAKAGVADQALQAERASAGVASRAVSGRGRG